MEEYDNLSTARIEESIAANELLIHDFQYMLEEGIDDPDYRKWVRQVREWGLILQLRKVHKGMKHDKWKTSKDSLKKNIQFCLTPVELDDWTNRYIKRRLKSLKKK